MQVSDRSTDHAAGRSGARMAGHPAHSKHLQALLSKPLQSFAHYVVLLNIIADLPILANNDLNRLQ